MNWLPLSAVIGVLTFPVSALGQAFNSGSNGSFGPITLSGNQTLTIPLPEDGIIHATTVTLSGNSRLSFLRNASNTPVYLLATGDVRVLDSAQILANGSNASGGIGGRGGPGGFDGGNAATISTPASDGKGPGGGRAGDSSSGVTGCGHASYGTRSNSRTNNGSNYGRPSLVPLVGGSGGGGRSDIVNGGGGGGGAILVASSTQITVDGVVRAEGGLASSTNGTCSGSGGAIRLVAPRVAGSGDLDTAHSSSGDGRIRIDTLDRTGLGMFYDGAATVGMFMQSFPTNPPRLSFTNIAGTTITGTNPVSIILPSGSAASQSITIRAENFVGTIPIRLALYPDNGAAIFVDDTINMAGQSSQTRTLNVTVPAGVPLTVHAWTR